MVRHYLTTPLADDVVDRIGRAAASGPTAGNSGGVAVVIVTDRTMRSEIANAADEPTWVAKGYPPWLSSAPLHLVLCADPDAYAARYAAADKRPDALAIPWWWFDAGAAFGLVLAAASAEGLGAGFIGGHRLGDLHELLGIPESIEIVGLITIGHAAESPPTASRTWTGPVRRYDEGWG